MSVSNSTQKRIDSYVVFLAIGPEPHERRKQLIGEVLLECSKKLGPRMYDEMRAVGVSHEAAEDLVHDIWLRWSRRLDTGGKLRRPEALAAYLKTSARNAAIRYLKRETARRRTETESARRRAEETEARLDNLGRRAVIDEILIARATPEMRHVFKLRIQGLTYPEIAKLNGKSKEAVRAIVQRVLATLRQELTHLGLIT